MKKNLEMISKAIRQVKRPMTSGKHKDLALKQFLPA